MHTAGLAATQAADIPNDVLALVAIVLAAGVIVAVISTIAVQWRKEREAAYNARLKQIMLERGMSAADIARVIDAGVPPNAESKILDWLHERGDVP